MAMAMRLAAEQATDAILGATSRAASSKGGEERDPDNIQADLERWSAALKKRLVQ